MNKSFGDYAGEVSNNLKGGLNHLQTHIRECLLLVIPLSVANALARILTVGTVVASGALISSTDPEQHPVATGALLGVFSLSLASIAFLAIAAPITLYGTFCKIRFVVRSHQESTKAFSLQELWSYESSFLPYVGLQLALWLMGIPVIRIASIVGMATFFLLGIPGFLMLFFYAMFMACSSFAFFENPADGVGAALSRGFKLISADWKRWLTLSVMGLLVGIVARILQGIVGAVVGWIPLLGAMVMLVVPFLCVMYFAIVAYRCYRDSRVAVGN
jgi:hypothetical protein